MALKLAYEDPQTGATNPEAYFRVGHVVIFGPKEGAHIHLLQYASAAARKAGKATLPGARPEFWVRNWVEEVLRVRQEPREVPAPDPPEGEERAAPTTVLVDVPYTEEIAHNDYDEYFGDAVFEKGGTTPTKQAYLYVMAQPEWAKATAA